MNGTLVPPRGLVLPLLLAASLPAFGQAPPQIGFQPADLTGAPFEFDTAEQDGIRFDGGFARALGQRLFPRVQRDAAERQLQDLDPAPCPLAGNFEYAQRLRAHFGTDAVARQRDDLDGSITHEL